MPIGPKDFGRVKIVLVGSKSFWSGPNHFGPYEPQNSGSLTAVVCFAELVYGLFGQSIMHLALNFCPDQPGRN